MRKNQGGAVTPHPVIALRFIPAFVLAENFLMQTRHDFDQHQIFRWDITNSLTVLSYSGNAKPAE